MKTAISIPDELFKAADSLANKLGISRSQLYQRAIHQYMNRLGQNSITEALNKVYGPDGEDGRLDPVLEYLQGASIICDKDNENW
jgi:hypothetical protein